VRLPLVPAIVIVYVLLATLVVETFIVEEPELVTAPGENVGFGPAQVALKLTAPVNPPFPVTVTL
jgi:hypothetical protein